MFFEPGGLYKNPVYAELAASTEFSRKELQQLYKTFKTRCPDGLVDEKTFVYVYSGIYCVYVLVHHKHVSPFCL